MTRLGHGPAEYEWDDLRGDTHSTGFAHHGVAVTESGRIVLFDPTEDQVIILEEDASVASRWSSGLVGGHGITAVSDRDGECVWIADCGRKMRPTVAGQYELFTAGEHGRVVKFTLAGRIVTELLVPPLAVYGDHRFSPTAIAVDNLAAGGTGRIWVADGYGQNLVHVYDSDARYVESLDGSFRCPHDLLIDRRRQEPELYVADRENGRIQVYGINGGFRRTFGEGALRRPSALAISDDLLIVAELEARIAVFDHNDALICYLGANPAAPMRAGWPNTDTADGRTVRPALEIGRFNSPHALAVDPNGNLVVAEWLIGGRVTRLLKTVPRPQHQRP